MIRKTDSSLAQCRANVEAALAHHELVFGPIATVLPDRVLFELSVAYEKMAAERLNRLIETGVFAPWFYFANHGATAASSCRECVAWASMQLVFHSSGLVEVDFDLANPDFGLLPAAGHLVEVLWPGKTNPWRVRALLLRRGLSVPLCQ